MIVAADMKANADGGPYIGRRAFTADDQEVFFGRDREIRDLRALWRDSALVILHGLAGSGKTSLLQAGVVPLLADDGEVFHLGRPLSASSFPEPLRTSHNPYSFAVLASWSPAESPGRLAQESITDFLVRHAQARLQWHSASLLLVAIDHLEEIFADERGERNRDEFFADLAEAMREVPGLRVLLGIRTDALSKLAPYEKQLSSARAVRFGLASLTTEAALEVVRRPMERVGGRFSHGAAEYIVDELNSGTAGIDVGAAANEVDSAIQPVQLQIVCAELWRVIPADQPAIDINFVRDNIDVSKILGNFCARAIMEVSDRYGTAPTQVFDWLLQSFAAPGRASARVPESVLITSEILDGVVRALENEHVLTAHWSFDAKEYQLANGHLAAAVRYLSRSSSFSDQPHMDTAARMWVAESALAAGEFVLAQHHAEKALSTIDPADTKVRAYALSLLGNIAYQADRPDLAERNYWLAAELREQLGDQPGVGRLLGAIGFIRTRQGHYVQALEELQLAVTRLPSDLALQTELATVLWRLGESQAAAAVFSAVLSVEPESVDALAGRGQIRAERGNAAAALDDLLTLRRLRPSVSQQPEVQSAYALALSLAGRSETAMAEADAALASAQDSAVIFVRAARVALAGGMVSRAKELLHQAKRASRPALSPGQRMHVHHLLAVASKSGSAADTATPDR